MATLNPIIYSSGGNGIPPAIPYSDITIETFTRNNVTYKCITKINYSNNTSTEITLPLSTEEGETLYFHTWTLEDPETNLGLATKLNIPNPIASNYTNDYVITFDNQIKEINFINGIPKSYKCIADNKYFGNSYNLYFNFVTINKIGVPYGSVIATNNFYFGKNTTLSEDLNVLFENLTTLNTYYVSYARRNYYGAFNNSGALNVINLRFPKLENIDLIDENSTTSMSPFYYARNINFIFENEVIITVSNLLANINGETLENVNFYVPDALVDSYKTASFWSIYASQIKPISELS